MDVDVVRGRLDYMRGERLVHVIGHFEIEYELLEIDLDH
jgi:hypothetical protein